MTNSIFSIKSRDSALSSLPIFFSDRLRHSAILKRNTLNHIEDNEAYVLTYKASSRNSQSKTPSKISRSQSGFGYKKAIN